MNIEQLRYVIEVAKTTSISEASENLYISQPALSKSLANLEKELGIKIFIRSQEGTFATVEGEKIIAKAREILDKLEELTEQAKIYSQMVAGEFILSISPGLIKCFYPILQLFQKTYPNIRINIKEKGTPEIIIDIKKNKTDIGLVYFHRNFLPDGVEDSLLSGVLLEGETKVFASKKSPLALRKTINPQNLQNQSIILYNTGYTSWLVRDLSEKYGSLKISLITNSTDLIKKSILEGSAISLIPEFSMRNDADVQNGEIVPISFENYDSAKVSLGWVRLKDKRFSVPANKFLEYLGDKL